MTWINFVVALVLMLYGSFIITLLTLICPTSFFVPLVVFGGIAVGYFSACLADRITGD